MEGRSPSGGLSKHIAPLSTAYFADNRPIEFLVGTPTDKRGGLNGSMQHLLKVFFYESTRLISFAGVNSNKTKPCLGSD